MKTSEKNVLCNMGCLVLICITALTTLYISTMKMSTKEFKQIEKEEVNVKNEVESYENVWNVSYDLTKLSQNLISDEMLDEKFYLENIPEEFADAFLYYSRNRKGIRPYFYSLMRHESSEFTSYYHKNLDGSIDKGPSQLNTNNIKSKTFRDYYNPKDESHITSIYCFYMVMSMNFYWDLVNKYGYEYAFYAYNGGEKTVKMVKKLEEDPQYVGPPVVAKVLDYDKKVRAKLIKTNVERHEYIERKRSEHIDELYNYLHETFDAKSYHNNRNIVAVRFESDLQKGNKLGHDDILYIRKEDLLQFEIKEGVVIGQTIIGTLNI